MRKANSCFPSGQLPAAGIFWFLTSWGAAFFVSEMSKNTGCFLSEWQTNRSGFLPVAVSVGTGTSAWTETCSYKPAFPHIFRWPHETTRKIWKSWFYNNISYLSWHLNHIVQFRDWESAMLSDFFLQISFSKFHIIHKISKIYFYKVYYGQNTECKNTNTSLLFSSYHFCIKFIHLTSQNQCCFWFGGCCFVICCRLQKWCVYCFVAKIKISKMPHLKENISASLCSCDFQLPSLPMLRHIAVKKWIVPGSLNTVTHWRIKFSI